MDNLIYVVVGTHDAFSNKYTKAFTSKYNADVFASEMNKRDDGWYYRAEQVLFVR